MTFAQMKTINSLLLCIMATPLLCKKLKLKFRQFFSYYIKIQQETQGYPNII